MLYTTKVSCLEKIKRKMIVYYLLPDHGNDEVIPDESDINYYQNGSITWEGFKLNYSQTLMRHNAMEWMQKVSLEAVSEDVVLVDEEDNVEYSCRKLLVYRMISMFSGNINLKYGGELIC